MNILVGLSGKPRSGKDVVADYLVENHGFRRYTFADYLKYLINKYYGIPKEELWGKKTETSRLLLHGTGALLNGEVDSRFFIKPIVEAIKEDYRGVEDEGDFRAVLTDVRRPEEAELLSRNSVYFLKPRKILDTGVSLDYIFDKIALVKIERKLDYDASDMADGDIESFPDTNDHWDYYLKNHSGLEELERSVATMVSDIETNQEGADAGDKGKTRA